MGTVLPSHLNLATKEQEKKGCYRLEENMLTGPIPHMHLSLTATFIMNGYWIFSLNTKCSHLADSIFSVSIFVDMQSPRLSFLLLTPLVTQQIEFLTCGSLIYTISHTIPYWLCKYLLLIVRSLFVSLENRPFLNLGQAGQLHKLSAKASISP